MVECNLPKVEVAGSSPVPRSSRSSALRGHLMASGDRHARPWLSAARARLHASVSCVTSTHGQSRTRAYQAWKDMVRRCTNPSSRDWVRYGGRGITVCLAWHRFENFLADMGPCPDNLTLDRINNDGNYDPGNCRWTTREQQALNRRPHNRERHPNAKLTVDDVRSIRYLAWPGANFESIASEFGVSEANVGYIVRRRDWPELDGDPHL
jgi:hypothetical protein